MKERGERGWKRDEKGRPYREEDGARTYRSEQDRDEALEERYTARPCERDCCPSILAGVAAHRDELVQQYMAWAQRRGVGEVHDGATLAQWEEGRFGARLYLAAHSLLLYGVKVARFGERQPMRARSKSKPERQRELVHDGKETGS